MATLDELNVRLGVYEQKVIGDFRTVADDVESINEKIAALEARLRRSEGEGGDAKSKKEPHPRKEHRSR